MGAPGKIARTPGMGKVTVLRWGSARYEARLPPEPGEQRGKVLGRYPSRYRATLELDRWLEQKRRAG